MYILTSQIKGRQTYFFFKHAPFPPKYFFLIIKSIIPLQLPPEKHIKMLPIFLVEDSDS